MVYLDNSATTGFKPPHVINAVANSLKYLSANSGRSGHLLAIRCATLVSMAREKLADFLGCPHQDRIIFTNNCTDSLNIALLGYLKQGHVITTAMEHNSVLRPLHELARRGVIDLTILRPNQHGVVSSTAVKAAIKPNTSMIALTHVSNVTGAINPVRDIGALARTHGIPLLVDAAQSVGYLPINMLTDNINILAFSPHKGLHAPQGIGCLAFDDLFDIMPTRYGGTGTSSLSLLQPSEYPECLECGTLALPNIAGLLAALNYHNQHYLSHKEQLHNLSSMLSSQLSTIGNVVSYTPPNALNGIHSINVADYYSNEVSDILSSQYNICTRSGLHCSPLMHEHLGTIDRGVVRISLGYDNTYEDIFYLIRALREISN